MKPFTPPVFARLRACAVVALAALSAPVFAADDALLPSHTCLPGETVLIARVPNGNEFLGLLRKNTKLGAVGFSEERMGRAATAIRDASEGKWEDMVKDMAKYNLKPEDWNEVFAGDAGFALVLLPREKQTPLMVGLSWLEPGGDLAERLVNAIQQAVDEHKGDQNAPQRVDMDLAGFKVMHLTVPVVSSDYHMELPDNYYEMQEEERQKFREEEKEKARTAKSVVIDQTHVFIARSGRRLMIGNTGAQSGSEVRRLMADPNAKIDLNAITGVEAATGVYARFLAGHKTKDPRNAYDTLQATPGLAAAAPGGSVFLDLLLDPRPLVKLADAIPAPANGPTVSHALQAYGVTHLGPMALRAAFDHNLMLYSLFASAPSPRPGLLALLDQPKLPAEPPAWVPSSAIGYGHVSFDLGKAYSLAKELTIQEFGADVAQGFAQAEQGVAQQLNTDIAKLLSSLGQQHSFVTYLPEIKPVAEGEKAEPPKPADTNRMSIVWAMQDEDLWNRVLGLAAPIAAMSNGAVAPTNEQGFNGYRVAMPDGSFEGGVFLGNGYLAIALGRGVAETTLNTLKAAPHGEAAMKTCAYFRHAQELMPLKPGLSFQINDMNRYIKVLKQIFVVSMETSFDASLASHGEEAPADDAAAKGRAAIEKIKGLLPTDDELEGMMGVSVGQTQVNDQGVVSQSVLELPPAK